MTKTSGRALAILLVVMLPGTLSAQRGRGRGDAATREAPAAVQAPYDNAEYGLFFPVPQGIRLYTPEQPGPFRAMFAKGLIIYLANRDETMAVRMLPDATEEEIRGLKGTLDSNPPEAKLPGYKKISVRTIKIGKNKDKEAISYTYNVKQGDLPSTVRRVIFLHNGRGFTFTFTTSEPRFIEGQTMIVDPLFSEMEFR